MPTLYLLAGPTASGKTEFAINFARNHNCEILSCDAASFYCGMDIGTAKPTLHEQNQIKHWGINIANPSENYSIKDYIDYSKNCIDAIVKRGGNILVVGGSGFYLKSFLQNMVDNVSPDPDIIKHINTIEQQGGIKALQNSLRDLDHEIPENFDFKNPRKLKKALERCLITGLSIKTLQNNLFQGNEPFQHLKKQTFLLQCPLEILKLRVRIRTNSMIKQGLIDEVGTLLKRGLLKPSSTAASSIGYRETIEFIQHPTSVEQLTSEIIQNTYALIKKQNTWFRHQIKFDQYIYTNCF